MRMTLESQEQFRSEVTKVFFGMIFGLGSALICMLCFVVAMSVLFSGGFAFDTAVFALITFVGTIVMIYQGNKYEKRLKLYIPGFYTDKERVKYERLYGEKQETTQK